MSLTANTTQNFQATGGGTGGVLRLNIDAGNVRLGTSKTKTISKRHSGRTPLLVVVTSAPTSPTPFTAKINGVTLAVGARFAIAPGATVTAQGIFAPTAKGKFSATYGLATSDPRATVVPVKVSGKGT